MKVKYGKMLGIDEDNRLITIKSQNRIKQVYLPRSLFLKFLPTLIIGDYLVYTLKHPKKKKYPYADYLSDITRIIKIQRKVPKVLYSHDVIQNQLTSFINSIETKMFLDLEMSMHPYNYDKDFVQEIIQVGYILVDANNTIIEEYTNFIQPKLHKALTKRTLKFLDLSQEDVDQGISFLTFYDHFKQVVEKHHPAIIVWGKNDELALKEAYKIYQVTPVNHSRFVNLLNLHKTFYRLKDDLGLLNAYKLYQNEALNQRHDALDDALMTKAIFDGFKRVLNKKYKSEKLKNSKT